MNWIRQAVSEAHSPNNYYGGRVTVEEMIEAKINAGFEKLLENIYTDEEFEQDMDLK
jgi:hypothetical protein